MLRVVRWFKPFGFSVYDHSKPLASIETIREYSSEKSQKTRSQPDKPISQYILRKFTVDDSLHDIRLDTFLSKQAQMKKSVIYKKIQENQISLEGSGHSQLWATEGRSLKANTKLCAGDVVVLKLRAKIDKEKTLSKSEIEKLHQPHIQALKQNIIYKDERIIIINKPAGLAVQGGTKSELHVEKLLYGLKTEEFDDLKIVHRLDKSTTGLLMIARSLQVAQDLSDRLASHLIQKQYLAIVNSCLNIQSDTIETGIVQVNQPPRQRMAMVHYHASMDQLDRDTSSQTSQVQRAVTKYSVLAISPFATLLRLEPLTGRKHQLRVHCSQFLKAPIVGDYKYGPGTLPGHLASLSKKDVVPLHLHMHRLVIPNWYGQGLNLSVEAPLPTHFKQSMSTLQLSLDQLHGPEFNAIQGSNQEHLQEPVDLEKRSFMKD